MVVSPIPTDRFLNLSKKNPNLKYQIFTVTGRMVKKGIIKNQKIDISSLKKGFYFIKLIDKARNIKYYKKIIKV